VSSIRPSLRAGVCISIGALQLEQPRSVIHAAREDEVVAVYVVCVRREHADDHESMCIRIHTITHTHAYTHAHPLIHIHARVSYSYLGCQSTPVTGPLCP
jgi:hypothetical protein